MISKGEALVDGARAGIAGTLALVALRRVIEPAVVPDSIRPHEHPPEQIVEWAEAQAGRPEALTEPQKWTVAMAAHFGFGAAMGALYGLVRRHVAGGPSRVAGAAFGVAVWATSVEGWMPALGIAPATTDKPPRKWPVPVIEHLVYGAVTALAYDRLRSRRATRTVRPAGMIG